MTPSPPMKWVDERQKRRLFGRASTLVRIVAPVVVYPDTLSNHALIRVNSPPQSTYGIVPKMKERTHERTMVRKPSFSERASVFFTKMNGKAPTRRVMMKLMSKGVNAESYPSIIDTIIERNINKALTRRALPTFNDMALIFIILHSFQFPP